MRIPGFSGRDSFATANLDRPSPRNFAPATRFFQRFHGADRARRFAALRQPREEAGGASANAPAARPLRAAPRELRADPFGIALAPSGFGSLDRNASTSTELKVTTADGDKVVLSLASNSVKTGEAIAGEGEGSVDYASVRNRTSAVNIQVEGNLSEQELADINRLARSIGSGGGGADVSDLGTIKSYSFSYTQQYSSIFRYAIPPPPAVEQTPPSATPTPAE